MLKGLGQTGCNEVAYGGTKLIDWSPMKAILFPLHPLIDESSVYAQNIKLDIEKDYVGKKCIFYSPYELERTPNAALSKIHEALNGS